MSSQSITTELVPKSGVITLFGYGTVVKVNRGHLIVEDGIAKDRRQARFPKVGHGLRRLVVIGSDGMVSLSALRWLADQDASFVMLDRDGSVLATTGPVRPSDAKLRRSQSLAVSNGVGLRIARDLIIKKLSGQAPPQTQPSEHLLALGIRPVFIKATTCDGKLASVLFSSFKEAISTSQRHELVRDLSDDGKMDTVLIIQMACEERNNSVSVKSAYGEAKCFGSKNCHLALDPRTGNILSCDPNGEPICGKELFKEFEYVLATTGINVKLE